MRISIRNRRVRKRLNTAGFDLQLTSMMDVLVIILIFLLKSYSVSTNNFTTAPGMEIPISSSLDAPPDSLQIIVTPEGIIFENQKIVEFVPTETGYALKSTDVDQEGNRILPLFEALTRAKDKSDLIRTAAGAKDEKGEPLQFDGILAITADRRVQYDTLRKVMYTAGIAEYRVFRFLALKREM